MCYYKTVLLQKRNDHINTFDVKKIFKKIKKKYLTNRKECDIIRKLSAKRKQKAEATGTEVLSEYLEN